MKPNAIKDCSCDALKQDSGWVIRQVGKPPLCPLCRELRAELRKQDAQERRKRFNRSLRLFVREVFGVKSSWSQLEQYARYYQL